MLTTPLKFIVSTLGRLIQPSAIIMMFGVLLLVEDPELANRLRGWQKRRKIPQDRFDQLS